MPTTTETARHVEPVRDVLLPDGRLLRVARIAAPDGVRIGLFFVPSQSQRPEGVEMSPARATELLRGLEEATQVHELQRLQRRAELVQRAASILTDRLAPHLKNTDPTDADAVADAFRGGVAALAEEVGHAS